MRPPRFRAGLAMLLTLAAVPVLAQAPPQLDHAARADGTSVVPNHFLRRWDPVTVFFPTDQGPAVGGPEDAPERLVRMNPALPGAWQWLGARALQFRPSEPWQPLRRVALEAGGVTTTLVPLVSAPVATSPPEDGPAVPDLDTIALTFPDPVDTGALARLLTVELRQEAGGGATEVLTQRDFSIKPVQRAARGDQPTYLVVLNRAVPDGRAVTLRLALADGPGLDAPGYALRLRAASAFAVRGVSCGSGLSARNEGGLLRCEPYDSGIARRLRLDFTDTPLALDALQVRQALRVTPPVDDLAVEVTGSRLQLGGRFDADKTYTLDIAAAALKDERGRALTAPYTTRFAFRAEEPVLRWDAGQGLVERLGPQMVPLRGQGYDRADLRIHPVDPLGRDFWPFPPRGLETDDATDPPLSGNEPQPYAGADNLRRDAIAGRIRALGSPSVSELVNLPVQRGGMAARFGLDVAPWLMRIAGAQQPGTYLLGLRPAGAARRQWMRVQVTDLALTAVEEETRIRFAVTSLSTALPVVGAEIRLEGIQGDGFVTLARGATAADGDFTWDAPGPALNRNRERLRRELRRIVVVKGNDTLVLDPNATDPSAAPQQYAEGRWSRPERGWLGWTVADVAERRDAARTLCHIFTERPIYRPEDPVHIQGYVRAWDHGALAFARPAGEVVVNGPSDQEWRYPVTPDAAGGFHMLFSEKTDATGEYTARFESGNDENSQVCNSVTFQKEAYRLPTFEVLLDDPRRVPLDAPFSIGMVARYFAGGLASDRPVTWRVAQFPESWSPPSREGFRFSTDSRFSAMGDFRASPVMNRQGKTDDSGAARLDLDSTAEPTAQPRRYVVEATVTGDDDIQVRATQSIVALPPFVLGVKLPRYIAQTGAIDPEMLVADAEGKPVADIAFTAKLIRRNWNSVLQASDFSQGAARFLTQVQDEVIEERQLTSTADVQALHFRATEAGVYLVELAAADRLGRQQTVRVDLFMAGNTPVTWARPPAQTVTLSTERDSYAPGESANLLIQSPFQNARALVVTEEPEGRFRYDWADVANGFASVAIPIRKEQMPKLAVHVLLMRGRLAGTGQVATAPFDQGKPVTLAATQWITVTPVQHRVNVALEAPASVRPGEEIEVALRMTDEGGKPLAGEAAFWMVDQAVLTLAREQPLDPLRDFIVERPTRLVARDTRNMAFGIIPLDENPGGGGDEEQWGQENISVRRNFTPVPVYLPRVMVGADGIARFKVQMPDTLTVFRMRAKAISGPSRFGFGTGEVRVRQPVVAQPALPRFLRPGDSFDAAVIGRVVEGPGGAGRATLSMDGLDFAGAREQNFAWAPNRPARIGFPVSVPLDAAGTAHIRFLVQRGADGAGDALEIPLPIQPDRPPVRERQILTVAAGATFPWPPPAMAIRPGTYDARLSVTSDPALVRMIGGLNYLVMYPWGCTEQRLALASSELALAPFAPLLNAVGIGDRLAADTRGLLQAVAQATDEDGLVGFWPRMKGSVWLTAEAYRFLSAARAAGQPVDAAITDRMAVVLGRALRSDSAQLMAGEELRERVAALLALAEGGKLEPAYVAELARRAAQMPTETLAQAVTAIGTLPEASRAMLPGLLQTLWGRVRVQERDGRPAFAGLSETGGNPLILPSETRSLAAVTLAVTKATPQEPRLALLRDGLVRLGDGDGWGTTNANAAALRALAAGWAAPDGAPLEVTATLPGGPQAGRLGPQTPVLSWAFSQPGAASVTNRGAQPVVVLAERRYLPAEPGASAQAIQQGFVLSRALFRVPAGGGPLERLSPGADGAIHLAAGDVVEEQAELVNPEDRVHVAMLLPIAAGLEPLNPNLATAPAEAVPSDANSPAPDWTNYGDDGLRAVWTTLPRGNARVVFRLRAQVAGSFAQPPGEAETMYRPGVYGMSAGARLIITP